MTYLKVILHQAGWPNIRLRVRFESKQIIKGSKKNTKKWNNWMMICKPFKNKIISSSESMVTTISKNWMRKAFSTMQTLWMWRLQKS